MKKIIFFLAICGFINADTIDEIKINVVKQFYTQNNFDPFKKFGTNSLKDLIQKDGKLADQDGIGCIDFDPTVSGNDVCDNPQYNFQITKNGDVEAVQICKWDKEIDVKVITYKLECSANDCKVDDVYNVIANENGINTTFSLKEHVSECLNAN